MMLVCDERFGHKDIVGEIIQNNVNKRIKGKSLTEKEKSKTIQFLKRKGFFWDDIEPVIQSIPWESA